MEPYIKNNVYDITYKSELILDIFDVKDLIRRQLCLQLTSFTLRKLSTH